MVVSAAPQLGRELGSWYRDRRWLSADAGSLDDALAVAEAADPPSITVIQPPAEDGRRSRDAGGRRLPPHEATSVPSLGNDLDVRILVRGLTSKHVFGLGDAGRVGPWPISW